MSSMQIELIKPSFDNRAFHDENLPQVNPKKTIALLRHHIAVEKAFGMIGGKMQDLPSLGELASFSGLSRAYFSHVFKEVMGMRLQNYLIQIRLGTAKDLLGNIDLKIEKVAYEAGFFDPNYFCRFFRKKMGLNPANWRLRKGFTSSFLKTK